MIGGAAVALAIKVSADTRAANADLDAAEKHVSKLGRAGAVAGKVLAAGLVVAAGAAVKFTQAAAEDAQAQAKLADTAARTAGATASQTSALEDWITAQGLAKGVTDDELRPALEKLLTATHSVAESQKLASLAMDISARTGKSLESVTQTLAKAQTGLVAGLGKYQVATKDAAGHARSLADVQADLAKAYTGAAAAAADTAAGKANIMKVQYGELQEQIGAGLLPVMSKLASVGLTVVDWISQNQTVALVLVGTLGGVLAVVKAVSIATEVWAAVTKVAAAAQVVLDAALAANPIGVIVIAIAALVAGLILAYKHSEEFRDIVNAAFHAVADTVGAVVGFIRDHWKLLLEILTGPIGIAVGIIAGHWDSIKSGAAAVIGWVKDKWGDLKALLSGPFEDAKAAISTAMGAVTSVIQGVAATVQSVIDKVNELIAALQRLAGAKGDAHKGGTFGAGDTSPRTSATDAPTTVNVNFHGIVGDPVSVGRQIDQVMRRYQIAQGGAVG